MPNHQKTNTYEVLLGELVGDLGAVHDEIKNLPAKWDTAVREACDRSRERITSVGNTNIARIQQSAIKEREDLRNAVKGFVEKPIKDAAEAMQASARIHREYIEDQNTRGLFALISFFIASVTGGSVGVVITLYVIGKLA